MLWGDITMTIGQDNLGNGTAAQERFAGPYRKTRRDGGLTAEPPAQAAPDGAPRNGLSAGQDAAGERPALLNGLTEPVFPPAGWDAPIDPAGLPIADHPLLRGLLLELPPKGSVPAPGWLDRWFEAARSILELLYLQDTNRAR
jgi:hypothetical protein